MQQELIEFLLKELLISPRSLQLGLKQSDDELFLPLILFQYGIITRQELEATFDWMDDQYSIHKN